MSLLQVIDLDEEYNVHEWNDNVNKLLKETAKVDSERNLDTLMKWYLQTLKDEISLKSLEVRKIFILKHIKFFKTYLMELNCLYLDNYLVNMENVLVHYFEIELKCLSKEQPNGKGITRTTIRLTYNRVTKVLYTYLLGKEDHVHHVLMKIKYDTCKETSVFMNLIYGKFLTKDPSNRSDLAFCRAFLLFEKWKKLRLLKSENKNDIEMEIFFYRLYRRNPQSVKENPVLQKILHPNNTSSILDVLASNQDDNENFTERYFEFFSSGNIQEGEVLADVLDIRNVQLEEDEVYNIDDDDEDDNEEFQKAYNSYLRSLNNKTIVDTIEIPDDDDNDEDCKIVEEVVLFHDISDDDEPDVIFVPSEPETSATKTPKDVPPKESEVALVVIDDYSVPQDDTKIEKPDSIVIQEPLVKLVEPPVHVSCRSVATINDLVIVQDDEIKETCAPIVVPSMTENISKKLVTTETQTDFVVQIDSLPTPSGSDDRHNDDPIVAFVVNNSVLPAHVINSDSDVDNSKKEIRSQSPTTSQIDTSNNKESTVEEMTHTTSATSQTCREDAQVSTTDNRSCIGEKSNSEESSSSISVHPEIDMRPDSSEDAARSSSELIVKREKIMYTAPQKLKKVNDVPDCVSYMDDSTESENPFVGQVDGRLNPTSSDKYNSITENFNLYDTPDDSLSDNNVSSSNSAAESANFTATNHLKNRDENILPPPPPPPPPLRRKVDRCDAAELPTPRKKQVTIAKEVTTSDECKPHFPTHVPKGTKKRIFKSKQLYIDLEKYSNKKIEDLLSMNEISTEITNKSFPKFSFMVCDFRSEKEKMNSGKNNESTSYVNFNKWREPSIDEGLNSNELPFTDKKRGKRKRQNYYAPGLPSIQSSDYRETSENEAVESSGRGRKKTKKDPHSVVSNGRSRKHSPVY